MAGAGGNIADPPSSGGSGEGAWLDWLLLLAAPFIAALLLLLELPLWLGAAGCSASSSSLAGSRKLLLRLDRLANHPTSLTATGPYCEGRALGASLATRLDRATPAPRVLVT